ncbi:hypothetical protein [Actinomadura sp. NAK00032]|uniref:hypothetical protein n=1 Tax=Actinomadura sp. NAK00032 TaxID=2742128 RepID=UPI001C37C066|nr:hypothetical protein [Actinomadura sp. NAK00032]
MARGTGGGWDGFVERSRVVGFVTVVLTLVGRKARFLRTPSAWDHAFRDREPC